MKKIARASRKPVLDHFAEDFMEADLSPPTFDDYVRIFRRALQDLPASELKRKLGQINLDGVSLKKLKALIVMAYPNDTCTEKTAG